MTYLFVAGLTILTLIARHRLLDFSARGSRVAFST